MTDAWFTNAIATDGPDGEGCRSEEAHALKQHLRNLISAEECCHQITLPTINSPDPGEPLLYTWGLLIDAMIELPGCQKQIVDLLLNIQTLPDVDLTGKDREAALSDKRHTLWRDLPGFANMWYDTLWWYYSSDWRSASSSISTTAQIPNIAAADALLANTDIIGPRARYEGLARLCDALEDSKAILDIEILIVREWVLNAGDLLFSMCEKQEKHDLLRCVGDFIEQVQKGEMSSVVKDKRNLWHGQGGASLQRWAFWKKRLEELQLHETTREAARISLEEMERVDGSG